MPYRVFVQAFLFHFVSISFLHCLRATETELFLAPTVSLNSMYAKCSSLFLCSRELTEHSESHPCDQALAMKDTKATVQCCVLHVYTLFKHVRVMCMCTYVAVQDQAEVDMWCLLHAVS